MAGLGQVRVENGWKKYFQYLNWGFFLAVQHRRGVARGDQGAHNNAHVMPNNWAILMSQKWHSSRYIMSKCAWKCIEQTENNFTTCHQISKWKTVSGKSSSKAVPVRDSSSHIESIVWLDNQHQGAETKNQLKNLTAKWKCHLHRQPEVKTRVKQTL